MLRPELFFRFVQRNGLSSFGLLDAALNRLERFSPFQTFQHELVAFSVLNDQSGPAVNGKDKRGLALFQPANIVLDVALELRDRADFSQIDRKSTRLNSSHLGISYAVFC